MDSKCTLIHWFRKGLRVHDNPALSYIFDLARASPSKYITRPIYILDAGISEWVRIGGNRWRFLQQSLTDLNAQLEALNSRLYVVRGNPASVFTRLLADWKQLECITYESDIEPYARKHDAMLECLGREHNVEVKQFSSHTVFNPNLVIQKNLGRAPLTYQKFLSLVENINVPEPLDKPQPLPVKFKPPVDLLEAEDSNCYDCPSLQELLKEPFSLGENKYPGGETEALRRLESAMHDERWVCAFEKPKTSPNSLEPSTTVLSPYLSFGCLSARLFYQRISECLRKHPKHSQPPVSLLGQLMWREFYYVAAASEPNFDRMLGNCFCLQIPWQRNDNLLEAWTHGRTGYPFIDAIMRQLRQEGWIHHLARHAVACFLTRGDLWISWEEGQKVFEELLLDQDWALNAGNWMWLSASAFFYKYFRVYSPVAFGKKTDPQGLYKRKYVPELSKYPSKYLYEPWKATLREQREYGCVLGEDYPHRIVNHEVIHKENIKKMSAAYKVNREVRTGKTEGNPDKVMETSDKRKASDIDTGKTTKKRQRI